MHKKGPERQRGKIVSDEKEAASGTVRSRKGKKGREAGWEKAEKIL